MLSWKISNTMDTDLVMSVLNEALSLYPKPEIFNNHIAEIPIVFSGWAESYKALALIENIIADSFGVCFPNTTYEVSVTPKCFFFPKVFL